jgi:hypothetical protein
VGGAVDAERHAAHHGDPGSRQPASERAGHLESVGRGPPRPHHRHRPRAKVEVGARERLEPSDAAGDEEHGGSVLEVAQARRIGAVVAADGLEARPLDRLAQRVHVQALELVGDGPGTRPGKAGDEILLGQREDLPQPAPLVASDLDRAGQPPDEPRPREAGRAGPVASCRGARATRAAPAVGAAHAANPTPPVSWR